LLTEPSPAPPQLPSLKGDEACGLIYAAAAFRVEPPPHVLLALLRCGRGVMCSCDVML
jgi:hypothetical protein